MADVKGIFSLTIKDAANKIRVLDLYFFAHDTETLADLVTDLGNWAALVDPLTEGQIIQQKVSLITPVSGLLKAAPIDHSSNEEGGLISYPMLDLPGRSYSIFIPALLQTLELPADETKIDLTNVNVAAFNTAVSAVSFPVIVDDDWQTGLGVRLRGEVAFRKLRRQTRRHRL